MIFYLNRLIFTVRMPDDRHELYIRVKIIYNTYKFNLCFVFANMLPTFNSTLRNPVRNTHAKHHWRLRIDNIFCTGPEQHLLASSSSSNIHSWNCHFSIIITIINVTFKHFLYIIINNMEYKYILHTLWLMVIERTRGLPSCIIIIARYTLNWEQ